MLLVEDLECSLPEFVLKIPRLHVQKGESFVLLGPTGAGKSSFLEIVAGFHDPDRGRIRVGNADVRDLPANQRGISIIFQEAYLFPHLNVEKNIRYGSQESASFERIAALLNLASLLGKSIDALSGGERQLVALARALMARPQILLLDEPFSSIDPQNRKHVIEAFQRVHEEVEITSIIVTHNFEEALYLGERLGILIRGALVQSGTPEEVFARPASAEIARFLGAENLFFGRFERVDVPMQEAVPEPSEGRFLAIFKTDSSTLHVLSAHEGPGYVLIPPQDITLSLAPLKSSALNHLKGEIRKITPRSSVSVFEVEVDAGLNFKVFITGQSLHDLELKPGSMVYLTFKASAVNTY